MEQVITQVSESPIETLKSMIELADTVESKLSSDSRGFMFQIKRELTTILNRQTALKK